MEKIKIALTGGIGSGKSAISELIKANGFDCVSCDEEYHKLLLKRRVLKIIKENFPTVVEGKFRLKLDRKALSDIVFNDAEKLKLLNKITHPLIMKAVEKAISKAKSKIVFVEIPLLFEGGYQDRFDKIIIVNREVKEAVKGVMQRSDLTEEEVKLRIKNQFDYSTLDLSKYIVINNTKDVKTLVQNVTEVLNEIKKMYE